ncbi:MAG: NADH-quinone oxidoreductase subunit C [Candidatus Acidiferrales bacterium]
MTEPEATEKLAVRKLQQRNPAWVAKVAEFRGEVTVEVPREHLRDAADFLRTDPDLRFTVLSDVTGVDRFPIEPRFELNYHLVSIEKRDRIRLKVRADGAHPVVPSVVSVWPTADWHEREVFDLFGVRFDGHPDLRRILMPETWEGHPLRKDYPVTGYR